MYILGISCWYHDSAAALIKDGVIIACSEEELFTRKKHDFSFPENSIDFCLQEAKINSGDIDYVVFYDKPIVKFDRILQSILLNVPKSAAVFSEAVPIWLTEKLKLHKVIKKKYGIKSDKVLFCQHHLAHAASSYYLSPFHESALLNIDGVGEWAATSYGVGKNNNIVLLEEQDYPHSLGLLYSAFTAFLGFRINNGEYKVMGMAPYGSPKYTDKIYKLVEITEEGVVRLNMEYFSFHYSQDTTFSPKFMELFGTPRDPEALFFTESTEFPAYYGEKPLDFNEQASKNQYYADIAASIQSVLEESLIKIANYVQKQTGMKYLCYAGGVALNSKANYRLIKEGGFDEVFIQPAASDAGGALGAALWCWCQLLGNEKPKVLEHVYLGKEFFDTEIESALNNQGLQYKQLEDMDLYDRLSDELISGKVVAWYQGRAEWGPRALGNRSILADPRNPDMKNRINTIIKFREPYRPFAPSILSEDIHKYILQDNVIYPDRFMLTTYPVKEEMKEIIPAVTHVNGTSRVQAVYKDINFKYWSLIDSFKKKTGVSALMNTSFNLRGEPIVNSPQDAVNTFMNSGIDILVMGNYIVVK